MREISSTRLNSIYLKFLGILGAAVLLFIIFHYSLNKNDNQRSEHGSDVNTESVVPPRSDSYMIYFCDGSFLCGGWADRLKGIITTYIIANATNRKFGIHMSVPCDISKYLLPNLIDWRVNRSKMINDSHVFMAISDSELQKYSQVMNLEEIFPHKFTYFGYNLDMVPYLRQNKLYSKNLMWMSGMENHEIYALIYKTLFRLTPQLDIKLQEFHLSRPIGTSLKCAQIRLGKNPSMSEDTEIRNKYSDVILVWDFLRSFISGPAHDHIHDNHHHHHHHHDHGNQHHDHSSEENFRIFVTADSEQVRSEAAALFPNHIVDLPGEIIHIERSARTKEDICDGFGKVILDQIVLASCETLIISKSGFGEISSYLRGKDTNLYCFRYSKLYKCSMSNFDLDFNFIMKIVVLSVVSLVVKVLLCYFFCPLKVRIFMKQLVTKLVSKVQRVV